MRILFMGDVVGRTGRETLGRQLPGLRHSLGIDLAIVNAENASHGFGLGPDMAERCSPPARTSSLWATTPGTVRRSYPYIAETRG